MDCSRFLHESSRVTGFFTTIRRGPDGRFLAVPYSTEYQGELAIAAMHLREAATLTTQPTLEGVPRLARHGVLRPTTITTVT